MYVFAAKLDAEVAVAVFVGDGFGLHENVTAPAVVTVSEMLPLLFPQVGCVTTALKEIKVAVLQVPPLQLFVPAMDGDIFLCHAPPSGILLKVRLALVTS